MRNPIVHTAAFLVIYAAGYRVPALFWSLPNWYANSVPIAAFLIALAGIGVDMWRARPMPVADTAPGTTPSTEPPRYERRDEIPPYGEPREQAPEPGPRDWEELFRS